MDRSHGGTKDGPTRGKAADVVAAVRYCKTQSRTRKTVRNDGRWRAQHGDEQRAVVDDIYSTLYLRLVTTPIHDR